MSENTPRIFIYWHKAIKQHSILLNEGNRCVNKKKTISESLLSEHRYKAPFAVAAYMQTHDFCDHPVHVARTA